jgi:hypothetical protein
VLELRSEEPQPNGTFTPQAALLLTPALRRSGLLQVLAADDLRTLIAALCCLTPNGTFAATPELVAPALGLSTGEAKDRLQRLARRLWQDKPLLAEQPAGAGLRFFVPSSNLFTIRHSYVLPQESLSVGALTALIRDRGQPIQGGFRERIIAHSRANYARPRAEVEAQINRFLRGEPMEEEREEIPTTPEEEARLMLKRQLVGLGTTSSEATLLLDTYPHERIRQQLEWLPLRHARNPAGFLLAAIEGDYDPPMAVRLQQQRSREVAKGVNGETGEKFSPTEATSQGVVSLESNELDEQRLVVEDDNDNGIDAGETVSLELPPNGNSQNQEEEQKAVKSGSVEEQDSKNRSSAL